MKMKMKRTIKLAVVVALALGATSTFAIENTKISGTAGLYYGTKHSNHEFAEGNMFDKDSSYADFFGHLDLTTDLTKGISAGVGMQVVTTLGVEHKLVSSVYSNAHTASHGAQVDSAMWIDELWMAGTIFDTTVKAGRQALDTPLVFTETWGVDKNTFEAVVLINQSLPGTTLIATYVGKSNGSADDRASTREGGDGSLLDLGLPTAGYVAADGEFSTFGTDGAYAFGAINNSWEPLTVQAWYYYMQKFAKAYWLQADLNIDGVLLGGQYMNTELQKGAHLGTTIGRVLEKSDTTGWSAMLGYEMKDVATFKIAYSKIDEDGVSGVANTATGSVATVGGQSKLYTEMWWNFGKVSASGAKTIALSAEATVGPEIDLYASFVNTENNKGATDTELTEMTFTASKSFGPLDTSLALIFADSEDDVTPANAAKTTDIQVYLTYNF